MTQADDVAIGQVITDAEQRIVHADDLYAEIVGRDARDMIGQHALSFTYDRDTGRNQPLLDRLGASGAPFSIIKRYVRGDGTLTWVNNHVSAVPGAHGAKLLSATCQQIARPFGTGALARRHQVVRRVCAALVAGRTAFGPDVLAAPATEALLRLYKAEIEGEAQTVENLAREGGVPLSVMLRWMRHLITKGLVECENDAPLLPGTAVRISHRCEVALDGILQSEAS